MTRLVRFDPFRLMDRWYEAPTPRASWLPRLDLVERDGNWVVRVEAPGLDADSIDVTVEGELLTVSGNRSFQHEEREDNYLRKEIFEGSFRRSVRLPEATNIDDIAASFKDGILEVSVPRPAEVLPKKVKVEVA
ncbi:MAG: Hsp20/alpha crystallin family protein [Acidimicrobiia bacterium]